MSKVFSVNFVPRRWQQFVLNRLTRFNLLVASRRSGKTYLCIAAMIDEILKEDLRNPQAIYLATTYSAAKRIAWSILKEMLSDLPNVRFYENELRCVIKRTDDVATIYLAGSESIDNLRGLYSDLVVIDEAAFQPGNLNEVILPFITDRQGKVIKISSVNGRNQFYKDYLRYTQFMEQGDKDFFTINLTARDINIIPISELELIKKNMTEESYRQEFENDFSAGDQSTFYGAQIEDMYSQGRVTNVPYDPMYPVDFYFDLGMSDYTSFWVRQLVGREFRYIDYYHNSGEAIPHYVDMMRSLYPANKWGRVVLPHDAEVRELSTGMTRREAFTKMGVRAEVQSKQSLIDGINAVRMHLPKCVFDMDRCSLGLEGLQNYRKKKDEKNGVYLNTPVHDVHSHAADAFRYAALDERPSVHDIRKGLEELPKVANDAYDIYGGFF